MLREENFQRIGQQSRRLGLAGKEMGVQKEESFRLSQVQKRRTNRWKKLRMETQGSASFLRSVCFVRRRSESSVPAYRGSQARLRELVEVARLRPCSGHLGPCDWDFLEPQEEHPSSSGSSRGYKRWRAEGIEEAHSEQKHYFFSAAGKSRAAGSHRREAAPSKQGRNGAHFAHHSARKWSRKLCFAL